MIYGINFCILQGAQAGTCGGIKWRQAPWPGVASAGIELYARAATLPVALVDAWDMPDHRGKENRFPLGCFAPASAPEPSVARIAMETTVCMTIHV